MIHREINLKAKTPDGMATELMFEIAGARADQIEIIRLYVSREDDPAPNDNLQNMLGVAGRTLRDLKKKGLIQFYATSTSFENGSTEASFLVNKYPSLFTNTNNDIGKNCIYIKI